MTIILIKLIKGSVLHKAGDNKGHHKQVLHSKGLNRGRGSVLSREISNGLIHKVDSSKEIREISALLNKGNGHRSKGRGKGSNGHRKTGNNRLLRTLM